MSVHESIMVGDPATYPFVIMGYTRVDDGPSQTFFVRKSGSLVWSKPSAEILTGHEPWLAWEHAVEQVVEEDCHRIAEEQTRRMMAMYRLGEARARRNR